MKCKGELKRKSQIAKEKKNVVVNPPSKDLPYPHAPTKEDKEKKYARRGSALCIIEGRISTHDYASIQNRKYM